MEVLSRNNAVAVLTSGGFAAVLTELGFHNITTQRKALKVALECCKVAIITHFPVISEFFPSIVELLGYPDRKSKL